MTAAFPAFVLLLLAVGATRIVEAVVSARRVRDRPDAVVTERWVFPAMVLLHVGVIVTPPVEVYLAHRPFRPSLAVVSVACLFAAAMLRAWILRSLGRAWNVRIVRPEEERIVTSGPYAWIRHPNYLVVILEIVWLPLVHGAWISSLALSALNGVVLYFRIRAEEEMLSQIPAWREAMGDRARLVPGLF